MCLGINAAVTSCAVHREEGGGLFVSQVVLPLLVESRSWWQCGKGVAAITVPFCPAMWQPSVISGREPVLATSCLAQS